MILVIEPPTSQTRNAKEITFWSLKVHRDIGLVLIQSRLQMRNGYLLIGLKDCILFFVVVVSKQKQKLQIFGIY